MIILQIAVIFILIWWVANIVDIGLGYLEE